MRLRQDHAGAGDGRGELRRAGLVVSGGPMLNGHFRGQPIGSGTVVWQMSEDVRAGQDEDAPISIEAEAACRARPATA